MEDRRCPEIPRLDRKRARSERLETDGAWGLGGGVGTAPAVPAIGASGVPNPYSGVNCGGAAVGKVPAGSRTEIRLLRCRLFGRGASGGAGEIPGKTAGGGAEGRYLLFTGAGVMVGGRHPGGARREMPAAGACRAPGDGGEDTREGPKGDTGCPTGARKAARSMLRAMARREGRAEVRLVTRLEG